jgi:hypothetical protein
MTSKFIKDTLSKKTPTKAHLSNKLNNNELTFILVCKMEIFKLNKIGTWAITL